MPNIDTLFMFLFSPYHHPVLSARKEHNPEWLQVVNVAKTKLSDPICIPDLRNFRPKPWDRYSHASPPRALNMVFHTEEFGVNLS
jgi:hypothetical protein